MKCILYKSTPLEKVDKNVYKKIVQHSIVNNKMNGVTGYLFLSKNKIVQLLEGEDKYIDQLYSKIKSDNRHTNVTTLIDKPIHKNAMPGWSMAIVDFWKDDANKFNEFELVKNLYETPDVELIEAFQQEVLN